MVSPRFRLKKARPTGPKMVRLREAGVTYVNQPKEREVDLDERLARMVTGHQGRSRPVSLGAFRRYPIPNEYIHISDQLSRAKSEGERKGNMRTVKTIEGYQSLLSDSILLYKMLEAHQTDRLPTVYEMSGLAALRYGIESPEFARYLARMRHLFVVKKVQGMWTSSPNPALSAAGFIVSR